MEDLAILFILSQIFFILLNRMNLKFVMLTWQMRIWLTFLIMTEAIRLNRKIEMDILYEGFSPLGESVLKEVLIFFIRR